MRRPPGRLHSGLVLLACTVYQEVYLPNLNIDAASGWQQKDSTSKLLLKEFLPILTARCGAVWKFMFIRPEVFGFSGLFNCSFDMLVRRARELI